MKWFKTKDTQYSNDLRWIEETARKFGRIVNEERDANEIISRVANEIADAGGAITGRNKIRWSQSATKMKLLALRGIDPEDPSQMRWHAIMQVRDRYAGLRLNIAHNGDIAVSAEPVPGRKLGPYAIKARDELIKRFVISEASGQS